MYPMVNSELKAYVEASVLPRYAGFDKAHNTDHVLTVMARSMELAQQLGADPDMVYTIAAYHDIGVELGRDEHHLHSGRMMRADEALRRWFRPEQIELMAQAAEDHRASNHGEPRSLYGKIVAEADRDIEPEKIVRRTVEYGIDHYPDLDREGHWQRTLQHLGEKYAEGGYMRLWIEGSRNAQQLAELRCLIADRTRLRQLFDNLYNQLNK
ncbi:MAG: HD domain-containing protein [Bacteroidales bacterium]|nr:HD domain-containing protein [Bacteroidales bacterium]